MSYDGLWIDVWLRAVRAAYKLAYGARMNELKGKRVKSFDGRGLHPYSEMWGRITLAESMQEVNDCGFPYVSPESIRKLAADDAYKDFVDETLQSQREETK